MIDQKYRGKELKNVNTKDRNTKESGERLNKADQSTNSQKLISKRRNGFIRTDVEKNQKGKV